MLDVLVGLVLVRAIRPPDLGSEMEPLERLRLARDRERMERDERRSLEQRATTMLAVTVALAGLGLAGLRQVVQSAKDGGDSDTVLAWAGGPLVYLLLTIVLLVRALTVLPPEPITQPGGESIIERTIRAERRSRAISERNFEVIKRVREATVVFAAGFVLLVIYAVFVALTDVR